MKSQELPILSQMGPYGRIDLIAEECGIDLREAAAKKRERIEKEELERKEKARIEEQEREQARKEAKRKTFHDLVQQDHIILIIDGRPRKTVSCPDGDLELGMLDVLVNRCTTARMHLKHSRHCQTQGCIASSETSISIPCTCKAGKHNIRCFISGEP